MNAAAQTVLTGNAQPTKASPDWLKSNSHAQNKTQKGDAGFGGDGTVELKYRSLENVGSAKTAKGLGLFSIGLGLAEIFTSGKIANLIGVTESYRNFLPLLGAREIASGIGILQSTKPTAAVWSRVGGDVMDLAYLGAASTDRNSNKKRLAIAAMAVLGVAVADAICANNLASQQWSESDGNPMAPTTLGQPSARRPAAV